MTNKIQTVILCAGLSLVAACGGGGGGSGDKAPSSILGESTKPGHLPDGTVVQPLTKEQNEQFVKTIGAINTVRSGVSQASERQRPTGQITPLNQNSPNEKGPPGAGVNIPAFAINESKAKKIGKVILDSCSVSASGNPPKETSTGKVYGKVIVASNGSKCPAEFKVDITADGSQSSGQNSGSTNMIVDAAIDIEIKHPGMAKELGLKSSKMKMISQMSATGSQSGSSLSMSVTGTESAKAILGGKEADITGQILFEASATGKSNNGNGPNDVNISLRAVTIYDIAGTKVLLQIFISNVNGDAKVDAYINGQEVSDKKLVGTMSNSPAIQSALSNALAE